MSETFRRITPASKSFDFGLRELWEQRDLLVWLGGRDLRIRYRQTAAGVLWAVLQPVSMMAVYTLVLGVLARVESKDMPYAVLVLSGLVPWVLFSGVLGGTASSLVGNAALITKVYFSRIVVVLSSMTGPLVDYLISLGVLMVVLVIFSVVPAPQAVLLPFFGIVIALTALGPGLWAATLNVRYRDVRFVIPFLLQLGLFGSPIIYPIGLVPEAYLGIYSLNPAVFLLEGFKYLLFGKATITMTMFVSWLLFTVITLVTGLLYLRAEEKTFADTI